MSLSSFPTGDRGLSITDLPIQAGVYNWGWVDYETERSTGLPKEISVVMFDEPMNTKRVDFLRRISRQSSFQAMITTYGAFLAGFLLVVFGQITVNPWIGYVALLLVLLSGVQILKRSRALKTLETAVEVNADKTIESYIAGKGFLRALAQPELANGDVFAYFNLRAQVQDLQELQGHV